jgi:hypothetical protein
LPVLPALGMRRRRRLDVWHDQDKVCVDGFYRDSYMAPVGRESVIHEYTVAMIVDTARLEITEFTAVARVLPWLESQSAPASAQRIVGRPAASLRDDAHSTLAGPIGCTHLNDQLRSLSDVPVLMAGLPL